MDYAPILKIARGKIVGKSRLVPNAVGALGFFEGDDTHRLISNFLELFGANPNIDCQAPLLAMYARMNCALHRRNIVCLLYERNLLPGYIVSELKFDSYDEIRKFYRQTAGKNRNDARNGINS